MKKIFTYLAAFILPMTVYGQVGEHVSKIGETININTVDQLVEAINNQKDKQTWIISAGTYDIADKVYTNVLSDDNKIGGASQFVFSIYADDLTIKGNGNVVITSSFNPGKTSGGNWHNQNFITIAGNNVLIENIKLKGNPNEYYDNQCNKVIELVNPATNLTLENAELLPIADSNGKINSGSIYIASTNPGYVEIKDVKMYSWISARSATSGKVQIKNVIQDFTNNTYAG